MAPTDPSTGTVGSDADETVGSDPRSQSSPRTRLDELERENERLRARIDEQRRARQELIDRYERLLADRSFTVARDGRGAARADGPIRRFARRLGLR